MLIESFAQTILKWLRIPPGSSVRKADGPSTSSAQTDNDYILAIIDITKDDVCIGEQPLTLERVTKSKKINKLLDDICTECNSVVKDIAIDLLKEGVSIYHVEYDKDKNSILLFPELERVEIYLTNKKEVVVYKQGEREQEKDVLVFVNYDKSALAEIKDKNGLPSDLKFIINPVPMQLKNADKTVTGLSNAEDSIARYRSMLKPVRVANVDIGISQGDVMKDTVDGIATAINAYSSSLGNTTAFTEFDDNIPVLPNRNGKGKVDIYSDIPSANISELADLNYWLSKLNLIMRFPATYMDFTRAMSETALSMVRGDLRYSKLVKNVQSLILVTFNEFIQNSQFGKYKPVFYLTTLPSSEDDDVNEALGNYCDIAEKVKEFVIPDETDTRTALLKLEILKSLFANSTTSPQIQAWFAAFETYIKNLKGKSPQDNTDLDDLDSDFGDDFGPSDDLDFGGGDDLDDISSPEEIERAEESFDTGDVEFIEPQT